MMDRRMDLAATVRQTVKRERLFGAENTVVAAVSGGADSMALLHLLFAMQSQGEVKTVVAAHLNHLLRGADADADEQLVRSFCEKRGIPFFVKREDVAAMAAARKIGLEQAGREARYAFFREVAGPMGAVIATAHTENDQAETVLLRMARGCGVRGAGGMAYRRDGIVRPLLEVSREAVERYCEENGIVFATDKTNFEPVFARNKVRLRVLPALAEVNDGAAAHLAHFADACREDDALLWRLADEQRRRAADPLPLETAAALEPPIRKRVFAMLCEEQGIPALTADHLDALCHSVERGQAVSLPGGWTADWQGKPRRLCFLHEPIEPTAETVIVPPCDCEFCGKAYRLEHISSANFEKSKKVHKNVLNYAVDYDKIVGMVRLRARAEGDRIHPAGRHIGKSLKKWMIELGIPAGERDRVPLLCDDEGIVLAVGLGCDERTKVDSSTKTVLLVTPMEDRQEQ